MQLEICEIFYSLQGESSFAGLPCIFIRLAGCNLNCSWCDTPYAREESQTMSFDEILNQVASYNCNLVEVTGGEPLMQESTPALISLLIKNHYQVLLETNGSISIENIHPDCIKVVDIKGPSSNEPNSFLDKNIDFLSEDDEIKFVVATRKDYDFAKAVIGNQLSKVSAKKIHLSPVWGAISPKTLAGWMIEENLHARLSLQQHKIIWNPDLRGV